MTDAQAYCHIIELVFALAFVAWAFWAELRIQSLTGQLILSKQKEKYEKIEAIHRALTEPALDDELAKDLGPGAKPPA